MVIKYLTSVFLIINLLISAFLWQIIYRHISKKAIISITIIDLIYRDVIFYAFSTCAVYSFAIIHTLINDEDETFRDTAKLILM